MQARYICIYKEKKTAGMMTRTCSKGMFNDFFGQWGAHVHCWCYTNKRIRKSTTQCVVSAFPVQLHFLWFKMENMSGVSYMKWPAGGEPALRRKDLTTLGHDYLLCPSPLLNTSIIFPFKKSETQKMLQSHNQSALRSNRDKAKHIWGELMQKQEFADSIHMGRCINEKLK